ADVIVSIVGASAAPLSMIAGSQLATAAPPALATAPLSMIAGSQLATAAPPAEHPPDPVPAPSAYWNPALRTGPSGVFSFTLQLPREPTELRALAWAAGPHSA